MLRNIKNETYIIYNVWDVINSLTFERGVSLCKKYCFQQKESAHQPLQNCFCSQLFSVYI